jgi:hypothetical protein
VSGRKPGLNKPAATLSLASWRRFERGVRPATLEIWINTAIALGLRLEELVGEER